jgi:hypothetical protein
MKFRSALPVLISAILIAGASPAFAADASPSASPIRADQLAAIHAHYDPIFADDTARFLVVQAKMKNDAANLAAFKTIYADFVQTRNTILANLADPTSDLDSVRAYAEEEVGEFGNTLILLEKQAAKEKMISCVKGKVVKKVYGTAPKCPTGYKKK